MKIINMCVYTCKHVRVCVHVLLVCISVVVAWVRKRKLVQVMRMCVYVRLSIRCMCAMYMYVYVFNVHVCVRRCVRKGVHVCSGGECEFVCA